MQLFCFTIAGGSTSFFDPLENCLGASVQVEKLEYAGHGTRHREEFYHSFQQLAEDMYKTILSRYAGGGYALFGYSMGSIAAVETLKVILGRAELPPPVHVFLASHEPQPRNDLAKVYCSDQDDVVKCRTVQFGGVPESLIDNQSFWRVYLPIYRADYRLIGEYSLRPNELKSTIPATIFFSKEDISQADIMKWREHFIDRCRICEYDGGHFFIHRHCRQVADIIRETLFENEL